MKKSLLILGTAISKSAQKEIKGGNTLAYRCECDSRTGKWSHPSCGSYDCRASEILNDGPLDFCALFPNDPFC